jgi:hypothetical protein
MSTVFTWTAAPLDIKDEELVNAYVNAGKTLDSLPYTDDFNRLVEKVRASNSDSDKHAVFMRLLTLRKQGRLPHVAAPSG